MVYSYSVRFKFEQCPQIGGQYGIKNKAAIAIQCELIFKLIAALPFNPYCSPIWRECQWFTTLTWGSVMFKFGQCPQIGGQYGIQNKAAIAIQCQGIDFLL